MSKLKDHPATPILAPRARLPDPEPLCRITRNAEALQAAHLAAVFADGTSERDRERRLPWDEMDRCSESGVGGITVRCWPARRRTGCAIPLVRI
ncbi:hypothetical protein [Cupriavidus basilensis]